MDLCRIPQTQMRFIHYTNSYVYQTDERGLLLKDAIRMAALLDETSARAGSRKSFGASVDIWVNVMHEGLSFLRALTEGQLHWNENCSKVHWKQSEIQVLTIVYLHAVRMHFYDYREACLGDDRIRDAFHIRKDLELGSMWAVQTPEVAS